MATGDPLIAINYHTRYYRFAESQPIDKPMSAAEYIGRKLTDRPVATIDTGFNGLLVQPFVTKWNGFPWAPWLGRFIRACAVIGIGAMPFFAAGRLLLVAVLGSLVPYMFTWNVGGGNAWRFTMHAYPCFFIAAAVAIVGAVRAVRAAKANPPLVRSTAVPIGRRTALVLAIGTLGVALYVLLPWFVVREAIAKGESTSVETGDRDSVFYRAGWSAPHVEGITVRVSLGPRAVVRLPLPQKRAYDIALRIDPVTPISPEHIDVLFNRTLVGRFRLAWNPDRVGTYRVHAREDIVNKGSNELVLIPSATTSTAAAGPRFAWLDPSASLGVRLWYVRVVP
jgi:hypothetical protein